MNETKILLLPKSIRISPSSLGVFYKCSYQYKLLLLDETQPDLESENLFSVLGKTFHKVMELSDSFSYTELRESWKVLFYSYMLECKYLPLKSKPDFLLIKGYTLLKNAFELKKRWKDLNVIGKEYYYRLPYPNNFIENTFISGKLDLIVKDEQNVFTVIDWKTGRIIENVDDDEQMSLYIFCIHKIFNIKLEDIFGAFVFPYSKQVLFTQRSEEKLRDTFKKLDIMLERISLKDFKKEPKINNKLNDCTFCPYIKSCDKL